MTKKIASQKTWKKFKTYFTKAVKKEQKRSDTLREIRISNQVKEKVETKRDNTETAAKFHTEQAQKIEDLMAHLYHLESIKPPTG